MSGRDPALPAANPEAMSSLTVTVHGKRLVVGEVYDEKLPLCEYCKVEHIKIDRLITSTKRRAKHYFCSQACAKNAATARYRSSKS